MFFCIAVVWIAGTIIEESGHRWTVSAISYILSNERYIGDSLWQKKYATDELPARKVRNHGEREQYYATGTQEAIIDKETFDAVRELRKCRVERRRVSEAREADPLRAKLRCGECGATFRKYGGAKAYLVCRKHFRDKDACPVVQIPEGELEAAFLRLYHKLRWHGGDILSPMLRDLREIRRRKLLWSEDIVSLNKRISEISDQNQLLSSMNRMGLVDPDIFIARSNEYAQQLSEAKQKRTKLLDECRDVPHHDGETAWNKNKISRILNCTVYLGTSEYPALIDRSLYDAAMARKPVCAMSEETRKVKAIREMSRCGCCGGRIRMSARREGWVRWNCADCGALGANATTENIVPRVEAILASLIRGEFGIVEPPREMQAPALTQNASDFAVTLEAEDFEEAAAVTAAMELASARYDCISAKDYETMRIRHRIEQTVGNTNFDMNLLRDVASEILIQPGGEVDIMLKNGQIIGRNGAR